ncbi:MAG: polysaccharide deacetylase family protein [Kiritimatiellia bacterium]
MIAQAQPAGLRLNISIHDVMPETMDQTAHLLEFLVRHGVPSAMLLVVPGRAWRLEQIEQLRAWQGAGCELAGHGWTHEVGHFGSWYHRLHGLLISRKVAEHLVLDEDGIAELIQRNHEWFIRHDFPPPACYVPPAWAMGRIRRSRLRELPFTTYEYLSGVYHARTGVFEQQALAGFEADTAWRALALSASNRWQTRVARRTEKLRIALHPHDLSLRLAHTIPALLQTGT